MPVKILVAQALGNVGKSTTVASLLYPRLNKPDVISVEITNEDAAKFGIPVKRYQGNDFPLIMQDVVYAKGNVIVDVGASQFIDFSQGLLDHPEAIDDYDVVIIPVTPEDRAQREAFTTLETLIAAGMPAAKLRILFNRVIRRNNTELSRCVEMQFVHLLAYADLHPEIPVNLDAAVPEAQIHADLASNGLSLAEMLADQADYASLAKAAVREDRARAETERLVRMMGLQRATRGMVSHLDSAFTALKVPVTEAA
jgi:hypothetical protein